MINERCRLRDRKRAEEKYAAIKELIDKGELTEDALKGNRHHLAE